MPKVPGSETFDVDKRLREPIAKLLNVEPKALSNFYLSKVLRAHGCGTGSPAALKDWAKNKMPTVAARLELEKFERMLGRGEVKPEPPRPHGRMAGSVLRPCYGCKRRMQISKLRAEQPIIYCEDCASAPLDAGAAPAEISTGTSEPQPPRASIGNFLEELPVHELSRLLAASASRSQLVDLSKTVAAIASLHARTPGSKFLGALTKKQLLDLIQKNATIDELRQMLARLLNSDSSPA